MVKKICFFKYIVYVHFYLLDINQNYLGESTECIIYILTSCLCRKFGSEQFKSLAQEVSKFNTTLPSVFKRKILLVEYCSEENGRQLPNRWTLIGEPFTMVEFLSPGLNYFFDVMERRRKLWFDECVEEVRCMMRRIHDLSVRRQYHHLKEAYFLSSLVDSDAVTSTR